jgi:hypothetical protein
MRRTCSTGARYVPWVTQRYLGDSSQVTGSLPRRFISGNRKLLSRIAPPEKAVRTARLGMLVTKRLVNHAVERHFKCLLGRLLRIPRPLARQLHFQASMAKGIGCPRSSVRNNASRNQKCEIRFVDRFPADSLLPYPPANFHSIPPSVRHHACRPDLPSIVFRLIRFPFDRSSLPCQFLPHLPIILPVIPPSVKACAC